MTHRSLVTGPLVAALAFILGVALVGCGDEEAGVAPSTTVEGDGAGGALTTAPTTSPVTVASTTAPRPAPHVFPLDPASACSYSDGHHDYPASDIFCPVGTTFVAVTDGVVDFVSPTDQWDPAVDDPATRGGLSVAVVGDDGVRYYGSHLSAVAAGIEPGARVVAGQELGRTGDSGNAAGTSPHLHFGISRPSTPDDWEVRRGQVNPFPYLERWRQGQDATPGLP